MDPWELFSELCRRAVEDQNVILEVMVINRERILMSLTPIADYENFDNWEDEDET